MNILIDVYHYFIWKTNNIYTKRILFGIFLPQIAGISKVGIDNLGKNNENP